MIVAPLEFPVETRPTFRLATKASTILLVDDDGLVRRLLQTILEYAGYTVLSAEDGPQAIQIAAWAPFDMLITDFQMPEMNGFVLAEQITKRRPRLPVLVISGAAMEDLPLEQIVDRDWSFLPKPIDRIRLLETIDESCHSRFSCHWIPRRWRAHDRLFH
jgi:DNA-binding NtrC family response regulator